jgi:hypothetical protein
MYIDRSSVYEYSVCNIRMICDSSSTYIRIYTECVKRVGTVRGL